MLLHYLYSLPKTKIIGIIKRDLDGQAYFELQQTSSRSGRAKIRRLVNLVLFEQLLFLSALKK